MQDDWSADDAQCEIVRRNVQAANERSEALVGKLWDIALAPLEGLIGNVTAEQQQIEAERKCTCEDMAITGYGFIAGNPCQEHFPVEPAAEREQLAAERKLRAAVEMFDQVTEHSLESPCAGCGQQPQVCVCEDQFSQAEREEHNQWLDEIYQAEQLERTQREQQEHIDDM